jgi:hypothetical protein
MAATEVFRLLLAAFGIAVTARAVGLLLRLRNDPPGDYTRSIVVISTLYAVIGLSAFAAAALKSAIAFAAMAGVMVALPLTRMFLRRHHAL